MVISLAVGRFPKWEFDTMVLGMSVRGWWTQKGPRIIKIIGFKGLGEFAKVERPNNRALLLGLPSDSLVAP